MSNPSAPAAPAWQPLYFLAALGAGGLAVTFFMYLMWMTPHAGQPIPSFSTLYVAFADGSLAMRALIATSLAGIAIFAALHVGLLIWNIVRLRAWQPTEAAITMARTNAGSSIMAAPLTYAMAINVGFIVGAVFVPGLWERAEWLFPFALAGFAAIGVYALRLFTGFMTHMIVEGGFDCAKNNSLSQMLSVFAFAMIGVGFSASAAMSQAPVVSVIGFAGAVFFVAAAIIFGAMFLVMGFRSMLENTANPETVPTLWVTIPFLTVVGIAMYRLNMALDHNFGVAWLAGEKFAFLITLFMVQLLFGVLGYAVMRRTRYFETYVTGPAKSPGSFALICPGVALFVFANFVINSGLVGLGVMEQFSAAWYLAYAPLVALQVLTIAAFFQLSNKLIGVDRPAPATMAPAQ